MKNLLITLLFVFPSVLFSQGGSLDLSYGSSGKIITCNSSDLAVIKSNFQSSNKIISFGKNDNTTSGLFLIRYNLDGS